MAGDIDGVQLWPSRGAGHFPEEHENTAIRRPGRSLVVKAVRQDALAAAIGFHDADQEAPGDRLGEGDIVAAWRPDRRRIAAIPIGDPPGVAAILAHHEQLLGPVPIGLEHDLASILRKRRSRIDRCPIRQLPRTARAQIHFVDLSRVRSLVSQAQDDALAIR